MHGAYASQEYEAGHFKPQAWRVYSRWGNSEAYGDRGAVLINTPDYNYMTLHPPLESLKEAEEKDCLPDL